MKRLVLWLVVVSGLLLASCDLGGGSGSKDPGTEEEDKPVGACEVAMPSNPYDADSALQYSCWMNDWDPEAPGRCVPGGNIDRQWWATADCRDLGYLIDAGGDFYYATDDHFGPGACGGFGDSSAGCNPGGGGGGGGSYGNPCASAYCSSLLANLADKRACDVTSASVPTQPQPFNQRDTYLTAAQLLCWTASCIDAQRATVKSQYGYSDAQIDASLQDYCNSIDTNAQNALALCSDAICLGNADCGNGACNATCTTCCWGGSVGCD
jgi:hypothetical protein